MGRKTEIASAIVSHNAVMVIKPSKVDLAAKNASDQVKLNVNCTKKTIKAERASPMNPPPARHIRQAATPIMM